MTELFTLPQIVSGTDARGASRAPPRLFGTSPTTIVELEPEEAELAKLFTNTWRYIKFAAANQFYMMANDHGLDFERIRRALAHDYPRAADLPGRRLRRRTVPVQGHDAAGRVHRQLRSCSATPRCWSTRACRSTWSSRLEAAPRPGRLDGRHPRHGVQGRERRHPRRACPTSCDGSWSSRPTRCCAPTRTSRRPSGCSPLEEVLARADILDHRRAARGSTATWRPAPDAGRRHLEPPRRGEPRVTPAPCSVVIPAYNEGESDRPGASTGSSRPCTAECEVAGRRRLARGHARCRCSRRTPTSEPRLRPLRQHLRPRAGQRDPVRHRPGDHARSSS